MLGWLGRKFGKGNPEDKKVRRDEFNFEPICFDPNTGEELHIYNSSKVKDVNGNDYICQDSRTGQAYDVYFASFYSNPQGGVHRFDDTRDIYYQVPVGMAGNDKNLLMSVALKASTISDRFPHNKALNAGIFETDRSGKWYSTGRGFKVVDEQIVDRANKNYEAYIRQKNREYEKRVQEEAKFQYHNDMIKSAIKAGEYQRLREKNLQNPYFELDSVNFNNRYPYHYVGTNILNPNWKWDPKGSPDKVSGCEFNLYLTKWRDYTKGPKKYWVYDSSLSLDFDYAPTPELHADRHIFFELPKPIDEFIADYPDGGYAILQLLSQPRIYTTTTPGIVGRVECIEGVCRAIPADKLVSRRCTQDANKIIQEERFGAEGPSY